MRLPTTIPRGVVTIDDLRERCRVDPVTHCWHWLGATSSGRPVIWTFDHARGEKRPMAATLAAWNIAHGRAPLPGYLICRACPHRACANPVHMREVRGRAAMGAVVHRVGYLRGQTESRLRNAAMARAAAGKRDLTAQEVRQIRAEIAAGGTQQAIADRVGVPIHVVSDINRGRSYGWVDQGCGPKVAAKVAGATNATFRRAT